MRDGRIIVPTNQVLKPAGRQITFPGRPNDVALSPDRRLLAVLSQKEVLSIDVESGRILGRAKISGASYKGIVFTTERKTTLRLDKPHFAEPTETGGDRAVACPAGWHTPAGSIDFARSKRR